MTEMTIPPTAPVSSRTAEATLPTAASADATFVALLAATLAGAAAVAPSTATPPAPQEAEPGTDLATANRAEVQDHATPYRAPTELMAAAQPNSETMDRVAAGNRNEAPTTALATDGSASAPPAGSGTAPDVEHAVTDTRGPASDGRPAPSVRADAAAGGRPVADGHGARGAVGGTVPIPTVGAATTVLPNHEPGLLPSADADASTAPVSAPAPATLGVSAAAPRPATDATEPAARMVARVLDAVDLLENAPPPRRMTVDLPDLGGLRLHVALRGGEVHVQVQGGSAGDLVGWSRDLSSALASRGFTLGDFGTDGGSGRQQHHARQPVLDEPGPGEVPGRRPSRPPTDGDLLL